MTEEPSTVESAVAVDDAPAVPARRPRSRPGPPVASAATAAASCIGRAAIAGGRCALLLIAAMAWFVWQLNPPGGEGERVVVEVQPGWGAKEAGDELDGSA